jgi:membrane protease YdiL (CAAX protease family)
LPFRNLVEAWALFFVLFFFQSVPLSSPPEIITHSLLWRVPAFILILLLMEKKLSFSIKRDLSAGAIALVALCITGFLVSLAAALTGSFPPQAVSPPKGALGWIAMILLSLSTGCLEEGYFRYYLPQRISALKPGRAAYLVSALIFALCHAYEGPWGFINALLAALALSLVYIKTSSFPGIAGAHGLYNIFVYLSASVK